MNGERDFEDLAASGILDELAGGERGDDTSPVPEAAEPPSAGEQEELEVLRRLHLEAVGLTAYALDPVAPDPATRARLLALVAGDETQDVSPLVQSAPAWPEPLAPMAPLAPLAPAAPAPPSRPPAVATPPDVPAAPVRPAPKAPEFGRTAPALPPRAREVSGAVVVKARRSRWPAALAALFALAAIGLGVWVAQLQSEVAYRESRIAGLERELARSSETEKELAEARAALERLESRYAFATAPATTVFALRPPIAGAPQPQARGHLFVAANQRDFRLEVLGLAPDGEAQDYQLWFIVDGLPQSGGVFDARAGGVAELADSDVPREFSAVAITLERKGGVPAPTTPILLIADSSVRL